MRGLDYYSGMVFECKTQKLGAQDTLVAGGRYDSLIKNLGALIGSGADVNIQDKDGNTHLHTAVLEGDKTKALNLLKKGARTDIKNNDGKMQGG